MKAVLPIAAVGEAALGAALLVVPSLVGQLILGTDLTGIAVPVARVAGIALIGLGIACWPGPVRLGMLTYLALSALYLAFVGIADGLSGLLLWPAVVLHAILAVLLARASSGWQRRPRLDDAPDCDAVIGRWPSALHRGLRSRPG